MSATVSSRFDDFESADEALLRLEREVGLLDSAIVESAADPAGAFAAFGLAGEARAACEAQLAGGGYLLLLLVGDQRTADRVLDLLDAYKAERTAAPEPDQAEAPPQAEAPEPVAETPEDLRIGEPALVRGGARVTVRAEAVQQQPSAAQDGRRRATAAELAGARLFEPRTIELSETRERPVVEKKLFVREEVLVRTAAEERVERIDDRVRHTEVEIEELPPKDAAAAAPAGG
jgi:hypothetical protein